MHQYQRDCKFPLFYKPLLAYFQLLTTPFHLLSRQIIATFRIHPKPSKAAHQVLPYSHILFKTIKHPTFKLQWLLQELIYVDHMSSILVRRYNNLFSLPSVDILQINDLVEFLSVCFLLRFIVHRSVAPASFVCDRIIPFIPFY